MSFGERLKATVETVVSPCVADVYTGDEAEYCVWTATEAPSAYGNNRPRAVRYLASVHWYFPLQTDPTDKKERLRAAIGGLRGCTWPTITPASDLDGGHLVFEFEAVEGLGNGKV